MKEIKLILPDETKGITISLIVEVREGYSISSKVIGTEMLEKGEIDLRKQEE